MKNFQIFLRKIWRDIYYLLAVVSPVGFNNNRQFLLKRQKTRIANNFWFRPNIWMKLSGCMRKYIVYDISLIFLMRQLFDKKVKYNSADSCSWLISALFDTLNYTVYQRLATGKIHSKCKYLYRVYRFYRPNTLHYDELRNLRYKKETESHSLLPVSILIHGYGLMGEDYQILTARIVCKSKLVYENVRKLTPVEKWVNCSPT